MHDELRLITYPDDILTQPTTTVEVFDQELMLLTQEMIKLMYTSNGIGLAAPQVGISKRIIVVDWTSHDSTEKVQYAQILVNPVITFKMDKHEIADEGCLSLPGVTVPIERSVLISCDYQNILGRSQSCMARGLIARIVQHEIDHLDGIVMLKYLKSDFSNPVGMGTGDEE